ncbi:DUF3558 domain-containing protein [Nocardia sp. NPDC051570]|uniref:DUF3558 domain-containing protein n=1 Tax=Nocardia sp. NPDC051570 TaxID=3364324 RepID=UPI003797C25A
MNRATAITICAIAAVTISGCSKASNSPTDSTTGYQSTVPASQSRPTLTAPSLQPPTQKKYPGRLDIVFDPCTWISDGAITKAGYDPKTRKRGDDMIAEDSFLTCDFSSPQRDLAVDSGNVTWDEDLQKVGSYSEPTTVNGRQALWVRNPKRPGNCEIDLRTKVGFVQITTMLKDVAPLDLNPCDSLLDTASAIEPEIGKDN